MEVYTSIQDLIDEDTFIVMDGGDYVQWGRSFMKARQPGRFIRLGPLSHLGAGLPYGMAAKLAHPESKVLVFIGDGAFGFYPMEFDTCLRHNLPITVVMGNDSTWGIDKTFQMAYFNRAVAPTCALSGTTRWWRPLVGMPNSWNTKRTLGRRWPELSTLACPPWLCGD